MIWAIAIYYFIGLALLAAGCRISRDRYTIKNVRSIFFGAPLWLPLIIEIVVKDWKRR